MNFSVVSQWKGTWGSFASSPTFCPTGSFAFGYQIKIDKIQDSGDSTVLKDIELFCRRPNSNEVNERLDVTMKWSSQSYCSGTNNPIVGFDVMAYGLQETKDDRAFNAVDMNCKDGSYISADVQPFVVNLSEQKCPDDYAVMGIRKQVQENQDTGDDTTLNGIELYCLPYP